jgi:hypothetical protein
VAELRYVELILSSIIVNLSIGTDAVADAVRELKVLLEVGRCSSRCASTSPFIPAS